MQCQCGKHHGKPRHVRPQRDRDAAHGDQCATQQRRPAHAERTGGEDREDTEWTWGDLRALTQRIAAGLRSQGVGRGDRVAAYMPNIPETAAAFLACASLGAVW